MIAAFVLIDAEPSRVAALGAELADIPGVVEAHSVAGHHDLVAVLQVADHEAVANTVTQHISALDGIRQTRTLISFRAYSSEDLAAAYEGIGD